MLSKLALLLIQKSKKKLKTNYGYKFDNTNEMKNFLVRYKVLQFI